MKNVAGLAKVQALATSIPEVSRLRLRLRTNSNEQYITIVTRNLAAIQRVISDSGKNKPALAKQPIVDKKRK